MILKKNSKNEDNDEDIITSKESENKEKQDLSKSKIMK